MFPQHAFNNNNNHQHYDQPAGGTGNCHHPRNSSFCTAASASSDGCAVSKTVNGVLKHEHNVSLSSSSSSGETSSILSVGILCQICSDRATGKHYGASSCDGCKGFFRRTIRKSQEYTCRFSKSCIIDKDKRNTCRYCRFQKCLRAGMLRNAVQSERDSISVRRTKNENRADTRRLDLYEDKSPLTLVLEHQQQQQQQSPPSNVDSPCRPSSSYLPDGQHQQQQQVASGISVEYVSEQSTTPLLRYGRTSVVEDRTTANDSALEPEDQLTTLKNAETLFLKQQSTTSSGAGRCSSSSKNVTPVHSGPPTPSSTHSSSVGGGGNPSCSSSGPFGYGVVGAFDPPTRLATIKDLADSIKEQLLLLVEWAKNLPQFIQLSLDDQVSLLRAYAAEHLLLGVARRSLPYEGVLLLSNDACIPRHYSSQIHDVNHVVFRILDELVEPMRELQLDDTENGCLKALLFFNPNAFGLANKQKVKETRQSFLEAFHQYVTEQRSQDDKVRFGNLLLLLPPLQAMSQQFIEDLQLATLFGISTFDKLLEELLLATASPPFLADGINAVAKKMNDQQQQNMIDLMDTTCNDERPSSAPMVDANGFSSTSHYSNNVHHHHHHFMSR